MQLKVMTKNIDMDHPANNKLFYNFLHLFCLQLPDWYTDVFTEINKLNKCN